MRQTRLPPFVVRKSLLVVLVLIFTCCSLHLKGRLKTLVVDSIEEAPEGDGLNENVEIDVPDFIDQQDKNQVEDDDVGNSSDGKVDLDQMKNYFEYDNVANDRNDSSIIDNVQSDNSEDGFDIQLGNNNNGEDENSFDSSPYRGRRLQQVKSGNRKKETNSSIKPAKATKSPVLIKLLESKTNSCTSPAYMEFPPDVFGNRARSRGAIIIHIAIVLYMFYCLAIVCENYFLPSLEECSQRLNLSQDVAGATFMAAGSSAPELFTAILGVFIAKGDVGTGTIVGSAVFNILFVIGLCSLYTVSTELNWWPVARDSAYYTFTVLVLIMCIYDGEVTTFESFILLVFYGVYILIMNNNIRMRDLVLQLWETHFQRTTLSEQNDLQKPIDQAVHYQSFRANNNDYEYGSTAITANTQNPFIARIPEVTVFEAANQVIIMHKRLFRGITRFRSAAYLVIIRSRKAKQKKDNFYADMNRALSMDDVRKMSRIGPDQSYWQTIPDPNVDGMLACAKWAVIAPLHASLYYTIPDCKAKSNMFLVTFLASITWTAIFSYIMVWMVTLIGFTLGIPDSIMGITFLAAGTSVPDAYASIHVAKLGQADMAVSNSIGSNVFDILVGLALPWFVETAIVKPGSVSNINSQGIVYAVVLLFLSLLITIYLFHRNHWTLNPHLGYSLLATYAAFLVFSSALEFNLFGYVNPPMCGE